MITLSSFDEGKHPRDSEGQWSTKAGANIAADDSLAEARSYAADIVGVKGGWNAEQVTSLKKRIDRLQLMAQDEFASKMPLERNAMVRLINSALAFINVNMMHMNPGPNEKKQNVNKVLKNIVKSLERAKNAFPEIDRGPHK